MTRMAVIQNKFTFCPPDKGEPFLVVLLKQKIMGTELFTISISLSILSGIENILQDSQKNLSRYSLPLKVIIKGL